MTKSGLLVVISAPSGGGKSTLIQKVLTTGNGNYRYSISATTRPLRPNEVNGRDYHFFTHSDFIEKREKGEFVEWAEVHGYSYATPKWRLDRWLAEGHVVFLDLDVDGGIAIKKKYGDAAVLIFVKPPSFERLVQRLKERNTESLAQIKKRLSRFPKEIKKSEYYDYAVVNEDLEQTAHQILKIVKAHQQKV